MKLLPPVSAFEKKISEFGNVVFLGVSLATATVRVYGGSPPCTLSDTFWQVAGCVASSLGDGSDASASNGLVRGTFMDDTYVKEKLDGGAVG